MKLSKYLEELQKFAKEHPEALDLECYTASDDEGNDYNSVHYSASLGNYSGDEGFTFEEDAKENEMEINSVCLN
jgi:hypothetical protein